MSTTMSRLSQTSALAWPHFGWLTMMTASWTLAGGTAGGLLGAGIALLGRIHPDALMLLTGFFALGGSLLGTTHGAVLGYLGRPAQPVHDATTPRAAAPLAITFAFVAALLIASLLMVGATLVRVGSPTGWVALIVALPVAFAALGWATVLGWHALEHAYTRWPDHRIGSLLMFGVFVVLLAACLGLRPVVPGTAMQLSALGCVLFAALATFWIAAPAVIVGLRLLHRGNGAG